MRGGLKDAAVDSDWRTASQDLLFIRKRSELLAQLLFAKQMFRAAALDADPAAALDQLLAARSGQRAIDIVSPSSEKRASQAASSMSASAARCIHTTNFSAASSSRCCWPPRRFATTIRNATAARSASSPRKWRAVPCRSRPIFAYSRRLASTVSVRVSTTASCSGLLTIQVLPTTCAGTLSAGARPVGIGTLHLGAETGSGPAADGAEAPRFPTGQQPVRRGDEPSPATDQGGPRRAWCRQRHDPPSCHAPPLLRLRARSGIEDVAARHGVGELRTCQRRSNQLWLGGDVGWPHAQLATRRFQRSGPWAPQASKPVSGRS